MILVFTLSMPGCPSWDGKWSGEGRKYVLVRTVAKKHGIENARKVLEQRSFNYRWDDGWAARIDVHQVDSIQAKKLRKESNGFCGYDWMIDSIMLYGKPLAEHEITKFLKEQKETQS